MFETWHSENGRWYSKQEPDKGEFPRRHTGELKCLYGCGISNTTPTSLPPPAPAKVMASSKRGNKQLQSLPSHWRGSWAQGEPWALRLNQYKHYALQPRTHVFQQPVILQSFTPMGFNKQTHLWRKPLVWPTMRQWQDGWFPSPQQSIKTSIREFWQKTGERQRKEGCYRLGVGKSEGPDQRKSQLSFECDNKGSCCWEGGELIYSKADVVIVVRFV